MNKSKKNIDFLYSDNIIFFDTEFTDLDIKKGELLSIGLVKPGGEELYLEIETSQHYHPWVKKHVLPHLLGPRLDKKSAKNKITDFIGASKPFLIAYVNQFDAVYWYELFGSPKDHPAFWIPIDFASILFSYGFAPNSLGKRSFQSKIGLEEANYTDHNALSDARKLADAFKKFSKYIEGLK